MNLNFQSLIGMEQTHAQKVVADAGFECSIIRPGQFQALNCEYVVGRVSLSVNANGIVTFVRQE
jgi:hypothetical protein